MGGEGGGERKDDVHLKNRALQPTFPPPHPPLPPCGPVFLFPFAKLFLAQYLFVRFQRNELCDVVEHGRKTCYTGCSYPVYRHPRFQERRGPGNEVGLQAGTEGKGKKLSHSSRTTATKNWKLDVTSWMIGFKEDTGKPKPRLEPDQVLK